MINPLANVPLNTKKVYVMATAPSGCEVYMPVDSFSDALANIEKIKLQVYLETIDIPPTPEYA